MTQVSEVWHPIVSVNETFEALYSTYYMALFRHILHLVQNPQSRQRS